VQSLNSNDAKLLNESFPIFEKTLRRPVTSHSCVFINCCNITSWRPCGAMKPTRLN